VITRRQCVSLPWRAATPIACLFVCIDAMSLHVPSAPSYISHDARAPLPPQPPITNSLPPTTAHPALLLFELMQHSTPDQPPPLSLPAAPTLITSSPTTSPHPRSLSPSDPPNTYTTPPPGPLPLLLARPLAVPPPTFVIRLVLSWLEAASLLRTTAARARLISPITYEMTWLFHW
jgi:hypothetical protein